MSEDGAFPARFRSNPPSNQEEFLFRWTPIRLESDFTPSEFSRACLRMGYTHETSFPASIGFGKASREMDNLEFTSWLQVVDSCKGGAHGPDANILNECWLSLDLLQAKKRTREAAPADREARCPKTAGHKERPSSFGAGSLRSAAEDHSETTRIQYVSAEPCAPHVRHRL